MYEEISTKIMFSRAQRRRQQGTTQIFASKENPIHSLV